MQDEKENIEIPSNGQEYDNGNELNWIFQLKDPKLYSEYADKNLNMKYYGWHVHILGLFPNIVSCQNNKSKDVTVKDMSLIQDLSDGKFS